MNLKKIIKEEINNDMGWIEDVSNDLPKNDQWMLINDVDPNSLEVSKDIQNYLFSKGLKWNTGRSTPLYQTILAIHNVLPNRIKNGSFTYTPSSNTQGLSSNTYPHHLVGAEKYKLEVEYDREELLKKGKQVYYWSQLKPQKDNVNESNDFQWIEDIKPIPNEILNINKYPPGDYKIWLGDIPKEQQLMILDYLIDVIEGRDDLTTSPSLYSIRDMVRKDEAYFNSLYFDIYSPGTHYKKKSIIVAMMAWYLEQGQDKYETLEYCRNYFDRHGDTELSNVKIKE